MTISHIKKVPLSPPLLPLLPLPPCPATTTTSASALTIPHQQCRRRGMTVRRYLTEQLRDPGSDRAQCSAPLPPPVVGGGDDANVDWVARGLSSSCDRSIVTSMLRRSLASLSPSGPGAWGKLGRGRRRRWPGTGRPHGGCPPVAFRRGGSLLLPPVERRVPVDGDGSDGAWGLAVEEWEVLVGNILKPFTVTFGYW